MTSLKIRMKSNTQLPAPSQPEPPDKVEPQDSPVPLADTDCTPPVASALVPQADPVSTPDLGAADTLEKPTGRQGVAFTVTEVQLALNLRGQGYSLRDIAVRLDRSAEGVRKVLLDWEPTQELAKATLKRGAVTLAERVIAQADVAASLEVLDRLDVLPKKDKSVDNRVQVVIGLNVDGMTQGRVVTEGEIV